MDHIDYHGNFTAEIFKDLFNKLCANIKECYGLVNIHMDSAQYHKHRVEQVPISNSRKNALIAWLTSAGIDILENSTKAELYELVKQNKANISFKCVKIAREHGHNLFYTPPYHCELQPIKGVWSTVKGEIARTSLYPNLLAIRDKLLHAFNEKITTKVIIRFWKRALDKAIEYKESSNDMLLAKSDYKDSEIEEIND